MKGLAILRESVFLTLGNWLPRARVSDRARRHLYRLAALRIGARSTIWGPITLRPLGSAANVDMGADVFINTDLRLGANAKISIGDRVAIGPRVSLETTTHGLIYRPGEGRGTNRAPITIEAEAWLGAGVIVTPGVTVGRGAVIAAGAVVVSDVEPMSLYGGVPAKKIRSLVNEGSESGPANAT